MRSWPVSYETRPHRLESASTTRYFRVFPGAGVHSEQLAERVMRLDRLDRPGYRGDYSFEVFNGDSQQMPLANVAERARRSAAWLGETCCTARCPRRGACG